MKLHPLVSALLFGLCVFGFTTLVNLTRGAGVTWGVNLNAAAVCFILDLLIESKRAK